MSSPFRSTGDLLVVVTWTALAVAAIFSGLAPSPIRVILTLPLVVLFPGYALLAVLFPERPGEDPGFEENGASITGTERFGLSVVVSLAIVPMTAFVLNYAGLGVRLQPLALAIGGLIIALGLLGFVTRLGVPEERRYGVPIVGWFDRAGERYFTTGRGNRQGGIGLAPTSGGGKFFNMLFVVSLLTLAATVGYATVVPPANDDPFSEFYLLTQDGNGGYTTEDLPKEYSQGSGTPIWVAIGNHERQPVEYTVVVTLDGEEIDRFNTRVAPGETKRVERSITPSSSGDNMRLSFQLYKQPPQNPSPENAYVETHLWVTVS